MTRHLTPIEDYPLSGSVNTGIEYNTYFESWKAAHHARLDMERWDNGGYDAKFMAKTLAFYRLDKLVEQHTQAALSKALKR